jgi:hypothetical protein
VQQGYPKCAGCKNLDPNGRQVGGWAGEQGAFTNLRGEQWRGRSRRVVQFVSNNFLIVLTN